MHSILAKVWLSLVAFFVFLSSCSREGTEPLWEAQSLSGNEYKGGLFPVYITLKEPVDNASRISWSTRYARIAHRKQGMNSKEQIIADTAFLYWETPPPLFEKIDSIQIKKDSIVSWKIDTTRYHRDTVFAIVNNAEESSPIIIEVKNILPRIKSIIVGDISKPGDSLLTIAANLGDKLEIRLLLEKPFKNSFNKALHPEVEMPPFMGNHKLISENDSVFVYEWTVPNKEISDSSEYLKIKDSGGYGERLYKVHLVVYTECGSVWVAAEKELVKYSPAGTEVARIPSASFNSISDISVNSKNGKLFVVDESKNSFSIYNNYGKLLYNKSDTNLFKLPSSVAVDLDGSYVWIADAKNSIDASFKSRLRRFSLISDSIQFATVSYDISGPIKGISINQFQSDFVWFAIPKRDTVGFTKGIPDSIKFIPNTWERPSMVSLDPSNGIAWVADSSRIVAIDTSGKILAIVKGFGFVSSVSANKGNVWASDILSGKVYRFGGPFKGTSQDSSLTIINGRKIDGFIAPISVSAYIADGGAWVIDKEAGMAVRLDSTGTRIASGTGLKLPILGKTLQKVE
jgi:DNA-binding beta-propeller fold protein YncE